MVVAAVAQYQRRQRRPLSVVVAAVAQCQRQRHPCLVVVAAAAESPSSLLLLALLEAVVEGLVLR